MRYPDLFCLSCLDVLPPDRLLEHLLNKENPGVGVDETKELVQTVLDVLPLKEDDPKRIQAQKEFLKGKKATLWREEEAKVDIVSIPLPLSLSLMTVYLTRSLTPFIRVQGEEDPRSRNSELEFTIFVR